MTSSSSAARALLAHYNERLASKLARFVMQKASEEMQRETADAILKLLPDVVKEIARDMLLGFAKNETAEYLSGDKFAAKAKSYVECTVDEWISSAFDRTVERDVNRIVGAAIKSYSIEYYVRNLPERYRELVEAELQRLAVQAAENVSKRRLEP